MTCSFPPMLYLANPPNGLGRQFSKAPSVISHNLQSIFCNHPCVNPFVYVLLVLISTFQAVFDWSPKGELDLLAWHSSSIKLLYLTPAAVRWYILSRDPSLSSCITSSLGRQILNMASVIWTNINRFTSTAKYEADRGSLNIEARKNLLLTVSVKMVRVVFQYFM